MRTYLLVAYFDPCGLETIRESVDCWRLCEPHKIKILNLMESGGTLSIPRDISLESFDGLIIHNTVSYNPENLYDLDLLQSKSILAFAGRKILLKQDEHLKCAITDQAIIDLGIDIVFTLTKPEFRHRFYPRSINAKVQFVEWMTGYVPERLKCLPLLPYERRSIDLSYRGSIQPPSFGQLAFEKASIADRASSALAGAGLRLDISNRWEDRKFGTAWYDFLATSVATLGVESGASILDRSGRIFRTCERLRTLVPAPLVRFGLLAFEEPGIYSAIAPRHFEAAATRTLQVMYQGDFSGVLTADISFLCVSRSHPDWDCVRDILRDHSAVKKITSRAFEELIASDRYSYKKFAASSSLLL